MKRQFIIISFLVLYLSSATGFAMNLHFCGSKLAEVKINAPVKKQCCKKESSANCCKDKHVHVKTTDHQQTSAAAKAPAISGFDLLPLGGYYLSDVTFRYEKSAEESYRGPPPVRRNPINLLNCTFRI